MLKNPSEVPGERTRVAIFQAFYRFHSSSAFSALMLARAGYQVDVFLWNVDTSIPMDVLAGVQDIFVHSFQYKQASADFGRNRVVRNLSPRLTRTVFRGSRRAIKCFRD